MQTSTREPNCWTSDEDMAALRRSTIFRDADDEELRRISREANRRSFLRGQTIADTEDGREGLVVMAQGGARLVKSSEDGREVYIETFHSGDVYGLPSLSQVPSCGRLESSEDGTVVLLMERTIAVDFVDAHPRAAFELLARQSAALSHRLEQLALQPVRTRLARELGSLARINPGRPIYHTHGELAASIGASQVAVTRELRALRRDNLISSRARCNGIIVLDPDRLANY